MKPFLEIEIKDEGEHWWRVIRIFGLLLYSRHDYTKESKNQPIGFRIFPSEYIDIDEGYFEEE